MESNILTGFLFCGIMLIVVLLTEKNKRRWFNWVGIVLTAMGGTGIIGGILSGTIPFNSFYFQGSILYLVLGIYLTFKKTHKEKKK